MTAPPSPNPDDKDWTWVLDRQCPDCGFHAAIVTREAVPSLTRAYAAALGSSLSAPTAAERSTPQTWSPLEYACHVRDVCDLFSERLALMLDVDDPQFPNWDQDATAIDERYWSQDPAIVSDELAAAADRAADGFARVDDTQWDRPGRRSNGSVFTTDSLARYFLHDLAHHAWDVSTPR